MYISGQQSCARQLPSPGLCSLLDDITVMSNIVRRLRDKCIHSLRVDLGSAAMDVTSESLPPLEYGNTRFI